MTRSGRTLLVVEERPTPSTDYYIKSFINRFGYDDYQRVSGSTPIVLSDILNNSVIFIRYVPASWRRVVEKYCASFEELFLFIDDDILDFSSVRSFPAWYQFKILKNLIGLQTWMRACRVRLCVSNPLLQAKYEVYNPCLLQPSSPYNAVEKDLVTVFYHGTTATHFAEVKWLVPVVEAVLASHSRVVFEIIGTSKVKKCFQNFERVNVLHPMNWPSYQALISRKCHDIGLVPLLDNPFNRFRSHVKCFDITQAGAVGIYADHDVYRGVIRSDENGVLRKMDQSLWIEAINILVCDDALRERLYQQAVRDFSGSCEPL
jgi:hypothetical protein